VPHPARPCRRRPAKGDDFIASSDDLNSNSSSEDDGSWDGGATKGGGSGGEEGDEEEGDEEWDDESIAFDCADERGRGKRKRGAAKVKELPVLPKRRARRPKEDIEERRERQMDARQARQHEKMLLEREKAEDKRLAALAMLPPAHDPENIKNQQMLTNLQQRLPADKWQQVASIPQVQIVLVGQHGLDRDGRMELMKALSKAVGSQALSLAMQAAKGEVGAVKEEADSEEEAAAAAAPKRGEEEKRVDPSDNKAYTKQDFIDLYEGTVQWNEALPVAEHRKRNRKALRVKAEIAEDEDGAAIDYSKKTIPELKKLLAGRGLPSTGLKKKEDYVGKLIENDGEEGGLDAEGGEGVAGIAKCWCHNWKSTNKGEDCEWFLTKHPWICVPDSMPHEGSGFTLRAHNVVASIELGTKIPTEDLQKLAIKAWNVEYNPAKWAGATLRIRGPDATVTLFGGKGKGSGQLRVMGVRSLMESKLALRRAAGKVRRAICPDAKYMNFKVENMVALATTGLQVKLNELVDSFKDQEGVVDAEYNPEIFPALKCTVVEPKAFIRVFTNGKVSIVGIHSLQEAHDAFSVIWPTIQANGYDGEPSAITSDLLAASDDDAQDEGDASMFHKATGL